MMVHHMYVYPDYYALLHLLLGLNKYLTNEYGLD